MTPYPARRSFEPHPGGRAADHFQPLASSRPAGLALLHFLHRGLSNLASSL